METTADTQAPLEELSPANTDEAAEIAALARALKRSSGFTLLFACCNDSTRREEVTKELIAACPTGTKVPRVVYLRKGEDIINLAAVLRERLPDGPMPGAVFVNGLENILPRASEAGRSAFVANLNAYRNALPAAVPCPLILWVADWLLGVLARSAPDFFSVKSGIYFFREEFNVTMADFRRELDDEPRLGWENVPRNELRARAEEIKALLNARRTASIENTLLAIRLAERLGNIYFTLYQLSDAEEAYLRCKELLEKVVAEMAVNKAPGENALASVYHQLGVIAGEKRNIAAAEQWYRKSLEIVEREGNERAKANVYHQLGRVEEERRNFAAAEQWYRKSLEIAERQGDEQGTAISYHQMGILAGERRDFAAAEQWYQKSLKIKERQDDEHGAAITYHQLGRVAEEQHDFAAAEQWYHKALEVKERQDDQHAASSTYHQLGVIAGKQNDFTTSEQWYRKALDVAALQNDEFAVASVYHQLGINAAEQHEYAAAEQWYHKSLEIKERQGNEYGAGNTYGQLGILAGLQDDLEQAGKWLMKSITTFKRAHDERRARVGVGLFLEVYQNASVSMRAKLKAMWEAAGFGPFPAEADNDLDEHP